MTAAAPSPKKPPGASSWRARMLTSALVGALVLGAVIAHITDDTSAALGMGTRAAFAHPLPRWHIHPPPTTRQQICSPPHACYSPPTTRRPPTTTQRRVINFPRCFPNCSRRPTTTTRRPATTTTRRPIIIFPPCFPNCSPPPPTTTQRPATTTTRRPVTTTTVRSSTRGGGECTSWACQEVNSGIENNYLPDDYNPNEPTRTSELREIIEGYGRHNPGFDTGAALRALAAANPGRTADRGDMFLVIAAGIGIDVDPGADPMEVAAELADRRILLGHDRDGDGVSNPYTRPDADPDSTMDNSQLAAFLDRIATGGGGGRPRPGDGGGGGPTIVRPRDGGDPDEEVPPCSTGLSLSDSQRSLFASQLRWVTKVDIKPEGEPGQPWPPHPAVPGGSDHLVVSESPVWPVVDSGAPWQVPSDDGCLWESASVHSLLTQLLPWRAGHRATIERADTARPAAGFDIYLRRWDNQGAAEQAQIRQDHRDRDVSESCGMAAAMISAGSYDRCRWKLARPGVWSWQARACFEGVTPDATFRECATLAGGVEWFREIGHYTSGVTLQRTRGTNPAAEPTRAAERTRLASGSGARPGAEPRHPASVG